MSNHILDDSILREYDIRGIVGETLGEEDARAIGAAFAAMAREKMGAARPVICVGYDGRLSSPILEATLVEGLSGAGAEVLRAGLGPTPMLYFAASVLNADGGVMITGSHNPPEYNGIKMVLDGASFYGEDIQELGRRVAAGDLPGGAGSASQVSVNEDYTARLAQDAGPGLDLVVAWDPGNGAGGEIVSELTKRLPGRHLVINAEIDGSFPNHHPDPTVEANLDQLKQTVADGNCDLGVAFDGDGDRIGVIDGQGRVLWGDQLLVIFARDVLSRNPGAPIIGDVKASRVLFDEIAKAGGEPVMWKTGHSLIKARMAELDAPLAGEMSGHIFFADGYFGFDDGLHAAVRLLSILSRSGESLAQMLDGLPQMVNTPELRFPCDEARKFHVAREVKANLAARGAQVFDLDGVRVETDDGWWLLRASNTQAVLVARCEAGDQAGLERLKSELVAELAAVGLEAPDFD